jgi:hypothetical protein
VGRSGLAASNIRKLWTRWNEWLVSISGRFIQGKRAPCTHLRGGWLDLRACLNAAGRKNTLSRPGIQCRCFCCPAHSLVTMHTALFCLQYKYVYINEISIIHTFLSHRNSRFSRTYSYFIARHCPFSHLRLERNSVPESVLLWMRYDWQS